MKLILVLTVLAIGTNLARPPIFGMLSNLTSEHEQGATIGVAQGAGSLARILGPVFATAVYSTKSLPHWLAEWIHSISGTAREPGILPYVICGVLAIATGLFALQRLTKRPTVVVTETAKATSS